MAVAAFAASRQIDDGADAANLLRASGHGVYLQGEVANWHSPKPDGLMPIPPHDETGHTWHHPDQVLFDITKMGVAHAANLQNYHQRCPPMRAS